MNNPINNSRRTFIKRGALVVSALTIVGTTSAQYAHADDKALDENFPAAKALGYVHDATKVDVVKFSKRKGPEGEKQFCNNCMLFTQGGLKAEGQAGEWGKCTIFPQGLVSAKGWCNTWVAKPS